jgi:RNA polymerase sigma-70 factor (ECF subfamily)
MAEADEFHDLIRRVRSGDQDAAADLVREFEPCVLRYARFQMRRRSNHDGLVAQFGASDICQSVLQSFFAGLKSGRYRLSRPRDLEKLLCTMARLHIASKGRKASVILRTVLDQDGVAARPDSGPGPEKSIDDKDFLNVVLKHLSADELLILVRKVDGKTWAEIAADLGMSEDSVRKKLARATRRIRADLRQSGTSTI